MAATCGNGYVFDKLLKKKKKNVRPQKAPLWHAATFKSSHSAARHSLALAWEGSAVCTSYSEIWTLRRYLLIYLMNNLCEGQHFLQNRAKSGLNTTLPTYATLSYPNLGHVPTGLDRHVLADNGHVEGNRIVPSTVT